MMDSKVTSIMSPHLFADLKSKITGTSVTLVQDDSFGVTIAALRGFDLRSRTARNDN